MQRLQMLKWRMAREVPGTLEHNSGKGIVLLSVGLPHLTHLQLSLGQEVSSEAMASLAKLTALQVCDLPLLLMHTHWIQCSHVRQA